MSFFFLQFPVLAQSIFRPFLIPSIAFTTFHFTLFYFICPRLSVATHESRDRQIWGVIKLLRCAGLDTAVFCQLCSTNLSSPTCARLLRACGLPPCLKAPCHSHRWAQMLGSGHHVSESNEVIRNYCQKLFMGFHKVKWSTRWASEELWVNTVEFLSNML